MVKDFVLGGQLFKSNYYSIGNGVFKKKDRWISDDFKEEHFGDRVPDGPDQLDKIAASLSGASKIEFLGSVRDRPSRKWAYSLSCHGRAKGKPNLIFSFEETAYPPETSIMKLARDIHGDLIPAKETYYGIMEGSNPPLHMYSTIRYGDIPSDDEYSMDLACTVVKIFPPDEKPGRLNYVRSLARYFARCWLNQQKADSHKLLEMKTQLQKKLTEIKDASWISLSTITEIENSYEKILSEDYPQVLTHRKLSENTIDLSHSGKMERISSWGNAAVLPFGIELEILFQAGGYDDLDGWIESPYKAELYSAFWNEFWQAAKIEGVRQRKRVRDKAETAAKIGVILGIGSNFDWPLKFNTGAREAEFEAWFPKQEASRPRTEERYSLRPRSGNINYS